jgi:hypothetical protein
VAASVIYINQLISQLLNKTTLLKSLTQSRVKDVEASIAALPALLVAKDEVNPVGEMLSNVVRFQRLTVNKYKHTRIAVTPRL